MRPRIIREGLHPPSPRVARRRHVEVVGHIRGQRIRGPGRDLNRRIYREIYLRQRASSRAAASGLGREDLNRSGEAAISTTSARSASPMPSC